VLKNVMVEQRWRGRCGRHRMKLRRRLCWSATRELCASTITTRLDGRIWPSERLSCAAGKRLPDV
jgi:hypothetical protein